MQRYELYPARLLFPWDSPGKNTGVGYCALLQESSQPRDRTCASCDSCIAGRFFTAEPLGKPKATVLQFKKYSTTVNMLVRAFCDAVCAFLLGMYLGVELKENPALVECAQL